LNETQGVDSEEKGAIFLRPRRAVRRRRLVTKKP